MRLARGLRPQHGAATSPARDSIVDELNMIQYMIKAGCELTIALQNVAYLDVYIFSPSASHTRRAILGNQDGIESEKKYRRLRAMVQRSRHKTCHPAQRQLVDLLHTVSFSAAGVERGLRSIRTGIWSRYVETEPYGGTWPTWASLTPHSVLIATATAVILCCTPGWAAKQPSLPAALRVANAYTKDPTTYQGF